MRNRAKCLRNSYDNIDRTAAELELIVDAISWNFNGHARCDRGVCCRALVWLPCTQFVTDIYSSNIPRQRRPGKKIPLWSAKLWFLQKGRIHAGMNHFDGVQPTKIFIAFIWLLAEAVNKKAARPLSGRKNHFIKIARCGYAEQTAGKIVSINFRVLNLHVGKYFYIRLNFNVLSVRKRARN